MIPSGWHDDQVTALERHLRARHIGRLREIAAGLAELAESAHRLSTLAGQLSRQLAGLAEELDAEIAAATDRGQEGRQ